MNKEIVSACLRLFKSIPIETQELYTRDFIKEYNQITIQKGFVFSPIVLASEHNVNDLIEDIEILYGISGEQLNSSFHKSWMKIETASNKQLVTEQIAHYLTTYGKNNPIEYLSKLEEGFKNTGKDIFKLEDFETDKLFDEDYVYIPREMLNIPEINEEVKLVVINGLSKQQLKSKIEILINSGIALKQETISDLVILMNYIGFEKFNIEEIKNKELACILYKKTDTLPNNPIEILRYMIYTSTGKTLIIKNEQCINEIKEGIKKQEVQNEILDVLFFYGLKNLSQIFYRFKPLFLAFRGDKVLRKHINKIRRLAKKHHKPMPEDYLNNLTKHIFQNDINVVKFLRELDNTNIFRKIRLLYCLNYYIQDNNDSIMYKIRNGKSFSKELKKDNKNIVLLKTVFNTIKREIIEEIKPNIEGKVFYIPDYIDYALPSSEKTFVGNIPYGSSVSVDKDMIFGVHWEDIDNESIDLDLSVLTKEGKFGWDGSYRDANRNILFSGDMTRAPLPNGASELFYVKQNFKTEALVFVNWYNSYYNSSDVPFKIIIAKEKTNNFNKNYMVNPNNVICKINTSVNADEPQKTIGLLVSDEDSNKFYFTETKIGNQISASEKEYVKHARNYLFSSLKNTIGLKEIIISAGGKIIEDEISKLNFLGDINNENIELINLSPENLEKDTILKLLA